MRVFVAHQVAGVHLVPEEWLEGWRASGFREATPAEIARWYDEHDMDPPSADDPDGLVRAPHDRPVRRVALEAEIHIHVHERRRDYTGPTAAPADPIT